MPKIDANEVVKIFMNCLFLEAELIDGKPPADAIVVDGILCKFGFNRKRIAMHKSRIAEMLLALPVEFHSNGGGGMSFLGACYDIDGVQWTGLHHTMGNLLDLGEAAGLCKLVLPRSMWSMLPGGMPYYVVNVPACVRPWAIFL